MERSGHVLVAVLLHTSVPMADVFAGLFCDPVRRVGGAVTMGCTYLEFTPIQHPLIYL